MALLSDAELKRLEKKHEAGIGSADIVDAFKSKGARFSEATLRKYVQLGLLPKSHRIGQRGRHRGSSGLYPVMVVRQINDIKGALDAGATLDEVRVGRVGLGGEVDALRIAASKVMDRFREAVEQLDDKNGKGALKRELGEHERALEGVTRELEKFVMRVARKPGRRPEQQH
jgi:hypothetical protein